MTIIIANKIEDRIRGCLKTWFIEPKPNVFVGNLNNSLCQHIVSFLHSYCKNESGFILIQSVNFGLGYKIINIGKPEKKVNYISGLELF